MAKKSALSKLRENWNKFTSIGGGQEEKKPRVPQPTAGRRSRAPQMNEQQRRATEGSRAPTKKKRKPSYSEEFGTPRIPRKKR